MRAELKKFIPYGKLKKLIPSGKLKKLIPYGKWETVFNELGPHH